MSLKLMEELYLGVVVGGIIGLVTAVGVMFYLVKQNGRPCGGSVERLNAVLFECGCLLMYPQGKEAEVCPRHQAQKRKGYE